MELIEGKQLIIELENIRSMSMNTMKVLMKKLNSLKKQLLIVDLILEQLEISLLTSIELLKI